jgi:hypothetical protein
MDTGAGLATVKRAMKISIQATTGAKILVWKRGGLIHASTDHGRDPQVCLAVDLFEVIADLAGLDLDKKPEAAEAVALADQALAELERGQT